MVLKNKRGMIFTLMVIALLTFFIITYSTYSLIKDRDPINRRINTLNSFVATVEQDLPRHLFISGYRTIFILQQYTLDEYSYITNMNQSIEEIFFNGTLYGEQKSLMDDGKFSNIESSLNSNANKINAKVTLLNPEISLIMEDSWNMKFILNTTLIIEDSSNLASWNRSATFESLIPINTFLDPIYHIGTSGKVTNEISQTPYLNFVSGTDYSNLTLHFQNSHYKESTSAPNFLDRLQGDFSASPNGIESLIYPQELINQGVSVKYKSVIDYIYFSSNDPAKYSIPTISNLILDDEDNHLTIYNVSGVAVPA